MVMIQLIENIEEVENRNPWRQRFFGIDPFDLSDITFTKLFRIPKQNVEDLELLIQPFMPETNRVNSISIRTKLLASLRLFASGSYQLDIGRNQMVSISQPAVSRCLHEIIQAFNQPEILNQFIKFPSTVEELRIVRQRFFNIHGFPGVIGCIDGTHIPIVTPIENEHIYVNRKRYHSLNVQIICDEKLKIMNVNARYPGSTHDSFIWSHSNIEHFLRNLPNEQRGTFYLLGDSGYPLRPWLITPIVPEPQPGMPKAAFNLTQRRIRSIVEMCHGRLKNRFRCLLRERTLRYSPVTAGKIINTCCVLHNFCIENNVPLIDDDENVDMNNEVEHENYPLYEHYPNFDLAEGRRIRQQLIQNYFN